MTTLILYCLVFCGFWIFGMYYEYLTLRRMPVLSDTMPELPADINDWPMVSIIVPACNEARHIEAAIKSRLALDYPNLEIIAINDRSTDHTGKIIDKLAKEDHRLKVIHIDQLPDGWLGKVHALHQGVKQASGQWYLFTDADVYFNPSVLRQAIPYVFQQQVNHLVCIPEVHTRGFWLNVAIRSFFLAFCINARLATVNNDNSKAAAGVGAFNLVEAEMFRRTPGFEWLRMEPVDDYGLGVMLRQAGSRTHMLNAMSEITVPWYENLHEMFRGVEKNSFGPGANYSWPRLIMMALLITASALAPIITLSAGLVTLNAILLGIFIIFFATLLFFARVNYHEGNDGVWAYLCLPAGFFLLEIMLLRSAWLCSHNNGIYWRGTHYREEELKAGQRVRL
jgi:cellulose synthase/poly-beta-1,6-N-acetylglucosamine synthase-like glycosyltransferase